MDISHMLDREFKVMVILTGLEEKSGGSFSKEIENIKEKWSEMKNSVTKKKPTLEGINSR